MRLKKKIYVYIFNYIWKICFQAKYLANLSKWIDQKANSIKTYDDYNRGVISWSGTYTIASFDENDIGLNEFVKFKVCIIIQ